VKYIYLIVFIPFLLCAQNNYSLYYDGGDYIHKDISDYRGDDNEGTLSFWAKYDSTGVYLALLGKFYSASANYYFYVLVDNSDDIQIWFRNSTTESRSHLDNGELFSTWTHYAITSDGSTTKIYVNGSEVTVNLVVGSNTGQWFGDTGTALNRFSIGARDYTSVDMNFRGWIDEVAIFDDDLTLAQLQSIYNNGTPKNISAMSNLVDYWRFETGSGTDAVPTTGNNTLAFGTGAEAPAWSSDTPGWDSGGYENKWLKNINQSWNPWLPWGPHK
jgi:hypothetical protein